MAKHHNRAVSNNIEANYKNIKNALKLISSGNKLLSIFNKLDTVKQSLRYNDIEMNIKQVNYLYHNTLYNNGVKKFSDLKEISSKELELIEEYQYNMSQFGKNCASLGKDVSFIEFHNKLFNYLSIASSIILQHKGNSKEAENFLQLVKLFINSDDHFKSSHNCEVDYIKEINICVNALKDFTKTIEHFSKDVLHTASTRYLHEDPIHEMIEHVKALGVSDDID